MGFFDWLFKPSKPEAVKEIEKRNRILDLAFYSIPEEFRHKDLHDDQMYYGEIKTGQIILYGNFNIKKDETYEADFDLGEEKRHYKITLRKGSKKGLAKYENKVL